MRGRHSKPPAVKNLRRFVRDEVEKAMASA